MKPIRVVRIIDRLNVGGPAKHVAWLSAGLDAAQFETTLVTGTVPPGEGDMSYFARAAGVEPVVIKEMSRELGWRDLSVIVKLIRLLFQQQPDIVHTHKAKAGAAGRVAALAYKWLTPSALWLRPRRCRVVHTFHGHIFHSYYGKAKTRLFVWIESLLGRFATDRIITISEQQRREISSILAIREAAKFQVIRLGIDFDEVTGDGNNRARSDTDAKQAATKEAGGLRRQYGIAEDEILVGIVGRLCEVKNHALFLRAAALLQGARARFVIIGDGHLRDELERQAQELGIGERVIFTGFREDVTALYGELDVVALTSLNEGTPLTLIEAMSCARAVAATAVGGVVDILGAAQATDEAKGLVIWEHGVTAASGDVEGFANALELLVGDAGRRQAMGERGRQFVRACLSKERLVQDVERLYRELLELPAEVRRDASLDVPV